MGILESLKLYFHMKYIRQECRKIQKKSIKDQCLPKLCFPTYFWKIVLIITDLLQGVPKKIIFWNVTVLLLRGVLAVKIWVFWGSEHISAGIMFIQSLLMTLFL